MSHQGKLSRAMAKSGAGDMLAAEAAAPKPVHDAPAPPPLSAPVVQSNACVRAAAPARPIQRVSGQAEAPGYSMVIVADRLGEVAAQVRALRGKILAMNEGRPPRVITITSGTREEGKSTVSANLAAALAEIEAGRVLLVDGDTLRPSLHRLFRITADTGLQDILHGSDIVLDNHVYETTIHNLDVLPAKPMSGDKDSESLLHQNCGLILEQLRKHYSFIIVDTPPVMTGSQAVAFGKHSDGVVLVARMEKTPRHVVKRAAQEILTAGAEVIGCILTHQKHHVPNFIYRFFGTTPPRYYRYGREKEKKVRPSERLTE